jgi:ribosomal protein L7/L12
MNQEAKQKIAQALVTLCKDDGHAVHERWCACVGIECGRTTCARWWGMVLENSDMIGDWYRTYERIQRDTRLANVAIPSRLPGTHPEPEIKYAIVLRDLGQRKVNVYRLIRSTTQRTLREVVKLKDNLPHTFIFSNWTIAETFRRAMETEGATVELFQVEE